MALDLALVIRGDQAGAKKAMDDTAAGIDTLGKKAQTAKVEVAAVAKGLSDTKAAAPAAQTAVVNVGVAAETAGSKFTVMKSLAAGAIGGIVTGLVAGGLPAAFEIAAQVAGSFFAAITDGAAKTAQDLKDHKDLVDAIRGAYNEAAGAASSYGNSSATLLRFQEQQNVIRLGGDLAEQQKGLFNRGALFGANPLAEANIAADSPFAGPIARFRKDLAAGKADVIAFRTEISGLASALPAGDKNRSIAEQILGDTEAAAKTQEELSRSIDLLKGLNGDANAAATALGGAADKYAALGTAAADALPALREANALLEAGAGLPPGTDPIGKGPRFSATGAQLLGYASGGFTGAGPADRVAGFVHGREYVFDAASTAAIGVGNLDAIRRGVRGYAAGGFVSGYTTQSGTRVAGYYRGTEDDPLRDDIAALQGAVRSFIDSLVETRNPLQAFVTVLSSASSAYLNKALGAVGDAAGDWVTGLFSGGGIKAGASIASGVLSGIPHLAGGGRMIAPGLALVGEEGPELVPLGAGDQVIPSRQSMALLGGRGGDTHIWNVQTPSPRAFAQSRATAARTASRFVGQLARYS